MFSLDLTPLRRSPPFRRLFLARACSLLIYGVLGTSIYLQLATLTSASLHVAAISAVMATCMGLSLLLGGSLADRMDRRGLILWSRTAYLGAVALLAGNALQAQPLLWPIYLAGAIGGVTSGISIPAFMAVAPALLQKDDLPAAAALGAMTIQIGAIGGPALAGLLVASGGFAASYALVAAGAALTVVALIGLPPLPPPARGTASAPPRAEAVLFVLNHRPMRRMLLIDLLATICVTPFALLPRLGQDRLGLAIGSTSLLFSAFATGAFLAGLALAKERLARRPEATVVIAALVYGAAAMALGGASGLVFASLALAFMGLADSASEIVRTAFVQQETPGYLMGRVSALWMLQSSMAPAIGNVLGGLLADLSSPSLALLFGGTACIACCLLVMSTAPRTP